MEGSKRTEWVKRSWLRNCTTYITNHWSENATGPKKGTFLGLGMLGVCVEISGNVKIKIWLLLVKGEDPHLCLSWDATPTTLSDQHSFYLFLNQLTFGGQWACHPVVCNPRVLQIGFARTTNIMIMTLFAKNNLMQYMISMYIIQEIFHPVRLGLNLNIFSSKNQTVRPFSSGIQTAETLGYVLCLGLLLQGHQWKNTHSHHVATKTATSARA